MKNLITQLQKDQTEEEKLSDKLYQNYVSLFAQCFSKVDNHKIQQLDDAGYLYYKSVLCLDNLIDNSKESNKNDLFSILQLQEETIKTLASIFNTDSNFWELWQQRKQEYVKAISLEKDLHNNPCFENYKNVADLKSTFGKVAIDCLVVLSNEIGSKKYNDLLKFHYHFSIGLQLTDDMQDLEEDFINNQFNWGNFQVNNQLINRELKETQPKNRRKYLHILGISNKMNTLAIENYQIAKSICEQYKMKKWLDIVIERIKSCKNDINSVSSYLAILKKKILLNEETNPFSISIQFKHLKNHLNTALNYLINQYNKNFAEAKHIMYLYKYEGFENENPIHIGDTFQRAMIMNCLLEIDKNKGFKEYYTNEINYIISKKANTRAGCWSYLPTAKEIAADADDLGEIIQNFCLTDNSNLVEEHCQKGIDILLNERSHKNGGIETWILPKKKLNELEKLQNKFNIEKWGTGPDTEVVANFLYGLAIYNKEKYEKPIQKGMQYLLKQQNKNGSWDSRWYYGEFYGTYVCTRLFEYMNLDYNKEKTISFLNQTQNKDYGWGEEKQSEALSTAFALLTYERLGIKPKKESIEYLKNIQKKDGSWEAVKFIRPRANAPYKSKTLTTAFVLRAISE